MSTNGVNVEEAEMADCDGEKVVTMMDVLQEQQEFEEDANAVLGASDDKNCTYSKGYIKRQALYACLTCCSEAREDPTKRAGVCLACSLSCHENHDLVELYTKRNFCCDCGNSKFNHPCQYTPKKTDLNEENKYNQNFSGLYCTCHRPYPDPDGVEEEMIQCIICEDWLHASHLEATLPPSDAYAEMVCKACMQKNDFLHDYSRYAVNGDMDASINESDISICNGDTSKVNGIDESEKEHAKDEEMANVMTEESKDGSTEVAGDLDGKLPNNADPAGAINTNLTNEDEQVEQKNSILESTDVDKSEESEDKPKDISDIVNPIAEETALDKDVNEENITSAEDTGNVKDESKSLTEEETLVDNSADLNPQNTTKEVETNKLTQEESTVPIKEIDGNDNITGESAGEVRKDEVETKTNETETETNNEDSNGIPNDQQVVSQENEKEPAVSNVNDDNVHPEKDIPSKESNEITNDQLVDSKENENESVESIVNDHSEKDNATNESNGVTNDLPVNSQETKIDSVEPIVNNTIEKESAMDVSSNVDEENTSLTTEEQKKENKRKLSTEEIVDETSVKKLKLEGSKCIRPRNERKVFKGATFWPSHFRQKLCTCNECIAMYQDLSVLFLIDPEDTMSAYEVLGKERTDGTASTQYEKGLEALSSLGRIQQINALTEYNKMRDKLLDFLKSFKDRREIVKEEDIKAFFAGMKPKREPDGVYFCK